VPLNLVQPSEEDRFTIDDSLLPGINEIFGGGIVRTSITILGGVPGAGKSTLSLQLCSAIVDYIITIGQQANEKLEPLVLYISAEEEPGQLRSRADRLKIGNPQFIHVADAIRDRVDVGELVLELKPDFVILDSLQGLVGIGPAHDEDALALCKTLKKHAVEFNAPAIIIDHVNKDEEFAGRMTLQHAVDTLVLFYIDEETDTDVRVLRTFKNRHGATPIEKRYLMTSKGLIQHNDQLE
jgi:DNA repair protein RadA/Sms